MCIDKGYHDAHLLPIGSDCYLFGLIAIGISAYVGIYS